MVGRVFTVDRLADLTNRELDEVCGTVTVARGLAYAKQGRVVELELSDDGTDAKAWVTGSNGQTYTTHTLLTTVATPSAGRLDLRRWASTCTCPVGGDCKHAVAVVAQVRESQSVLDRVNGRPSAPPRPTWERALGGLLDDNELEPEHTPVGILIEPAAGPRRDEPARAQLRIRPVVPGVRGGWIRTGVSWETFAGGYYGFGRVSFADEHRDALTAIADAHRRSVRAFGYGRMPDAILLDHLGPGWAGLLRAADRAGVRLLTDLADGGEVAFAPDPAELVVDVVRTDEGAELHPRLDLPVSPTGARPTLVGQPATGFFLHDDETLVLGALAEPLDGTRQRLLDLGVVEVPEADWARFTVTHLPGLRRKARVRAASGDLELPDAVPPRLALRVTFEAGHRAHLEWGFRYGTVAGGVLVPMAADDPDPMRDRAAERALVDDLLEVDEVAGFDQLWQVVARVRRLVPETRLHGFTTVAFADVLPVLEELPAVELTVVGEPAAYSEAVDAPLIQVSTSDPVDGAPTDWFDLGVSVTVGGEDVAVRAALRGARPR